MAITISGDSPSFSSTYQGGVITSGTATASTSGTSIDFTGIPSWVKRITVMFNGVSTNGTSLIQVQIGAGSVVTSGYVSYTQLSTNAGVSNTSGFALSGANAASYTFTGNMIIDLIGSNAWVESHVMSYGNGCAWGAGSLSLSGALDRVRITTVNGTDTFDAGSINILYE